MYRTRDYLRQRAFNRGIKSRKIIQSVLNHAKVLLKKSTKKTKAIGIKSAHYFETCGSQISFNANPHLLLN
jgi:hypothetical protein